MYATGGFLWTKPLCGLGLGCSSIIVIAKFVHT